MTYDSQKRATAAYRKRSVKQLVIRFYPNDDDENMYKWLKAQNNTTEYIKSLIREDMNNERELPE
nr:MAG TPA: hypothetical protein [Caudoviricetes sp.]